MGVLGAAGMWDKMDSEQKADQKPGKKSEAKQEKGEDSSDEEKEPWQEHAECVDLYQKLNGEVVALQKELRGLVMEDPALIHAVTPAQKQGLFAVVAELMERARQAVSRAWYDQWVRDDVNTKPQAFSELIEAPLGFVLSASSWDKVAAPCIEARLLRLAALVDSALLCSMLQDDLFNHAIQLAAPEDV